MTVHSLQRHPFSVTHVALFLYLWPKACSTSIKATNAAHRSRGPHYELNDPPVELSDGYRVDFTEPALPTQGWSYSLDAVFDRVPRTGASPV
jgi:hypothetical protein